MGKSSNFLLAASLLLSVEGKAQLCQPSDLPLNPDENGYVTLERDDNSTDRLYWVKLKARKAPVKGTMFYLAGGPISHYLYLPLARHFQSLSFPDYDVVLYDYYGLNCSRAIQDFDTLKENVDRVSISAMAKDFVTLKRAITGNSEASIMGGSHGAMLGAEIVSKYPDDIKHAILFAGVPQSGWFKDSWFRFDQVLNKMAGSSEDFARSLDELLQKAETGKLEIVFEKDKVIIDRPTLEVALWMVYSQNVLQQNLLYEEVPAALMGSTGWLANAVLAVAQVSSPIPPEDPPTLNSEVTHFHRCNIWFPPSMRKSSQSKGRFLTYQNFYDYWSSICAPYDELGEYPQNSIPKKPTEVPTLVWVGERDYFHPESAEKQFRLISNRLEFHIKHGWSHDFGLNAEDGIAEAAEMITDFINRN